MNGVFLYRLEANSAIFDELMNSDAIEISAERGGAAIRLSAEAPDLMEQP